MNNKKLSYNIVIGDIIKLNESDIIYEVNNITDFSICLENTNKNDNRIARVITTTDYYMTEPIKRWQDKLEEIGFEYISKL